MKWQGVFPAITTPFREDLSVDLEFLPRHLEAMVRAGCRGFVPLGSLGESATLTLEEKGAILETCRRVLAGRAPLVPGIAALSTAEAVATARMAHEMGCDGLMVLPPYVFRPDRRETAAHLSAVLDSIQKQPVKMVVRAAYQSDRPSQWIAERAKINAVALPFTVGGDDAAKDLYGLFDDTIQRLLKGAQ